MPNDRYRKKPATPDGDDWHNADIVAGLHKAGWSLRRLSASVGLHPGSLGQALHQPYHRAERIIASVLGVHPQEIWPSRYFADGTPRPIKQCTPANRGRNTQGPPPG